MMMVVYTHVLKLYYTFSCRFDSKVRSFTGGGRFWVQQRMNGCWGFMITSNSHNTVQRKWKKSEERKVKKERKVKETGKKKVWLFSESTRVLYSKRWIIPIRLVVYLLVSLYFNFFFCLVTYQEPPNNLVSAHSFF